MSRRPADPTGRRRVIRAPNHLGDVVMALPALADAGADVVVRAWLAPIVRMAGIDASVLPLEPGGAGWRRAVLELRRRGYTDGTLLTPAFSAAWLFRWGGVGRLRGTASDGRSWMLGERVPREALRGLHRLHQYRLLTGQPVEGPPRYRRLSPDPLTVASWRDRLGGGRVVGLFPGSNAPARRWPAAGFAKVARGFSALGARIVVMGSPAERALTAEVTAAAPGALDAGGATDLPGLAALMAACDLVVTNDTGPMHLAAAVGARTVTLWGPSDPEEVGPPGPGHARVDGAALPCRPCFKNHCPRSGAGTLLPEAREECMRLIDAGHVLGAAEALLEEKIP